MVRKFILFQTQIEQKKSLEIKGNRSLFKKKNNYRIFHKFYYWSWWYILQLGILSSIQFNIYLHTSLYGYSL